MYAKKASTGNKKDNAAACFYFLTYLASLRPAADQIGYVLT
jgi:hypothetical protein